MVIFLYGPDSYKRQKKLQELISEYQKKNSAFSESVFDLENQQDFFRLRELFTQSSLFSPKKLTVLKNISSVKEDEREDLKNLIKSVLKSGDDILIVSDDSAPAQDFSFLSEKPAIAQEFKVLGAAKGEFFIAREAEARGIELTSKAAAYLVKVFKNATWGAINELDKLQFLGIKKFDAPDLEKLIFYSEAPEIFRFTNNAPKSGYLPQKLYDLELLFSHQEEPAKIFNILSASRFLKQESIERLADYDALIKSGKLDYETALFDFCL